MLQLRVTNRVPKIAAPSAPIRSCTGTISFHDKKPLESNYFGAMPKYTSALVSGSQGRKRILGEIPAVPLHTGNYPVLDVIILYSPRCSLNHSSCLWRKASKFLYNLAHEEDPPPGHQVVISGQAGRNLCRDPG